MLKRRRWAVNPTLYRKKQQDYRAKIDEYRSPCLGCESIGECKLEKVSCGFYKALEKLKEYEDLEEQGKLVRLPCKVGDTIYYLYIPRDEEPQIIEMEVVSVEPCGAIRNNKGVCEVWNVYAETDFIKEYFKFFDFSKTVFLTQEEAEAALKNIGKDE